MRVAQLGHLMESAESSLSALQADEIARAQLLLDEKEDAEEAQVDEDEAAPLEADINDVELSFDELREMMQAEDDVRAEEEEQRRATEVAKAKAAKEAEIQRLAEEEEEEERQRQEAEKKKEAARQAKLSQQRAEEEKKKKKAKEAAEAAATESAKKSAHARAVLPGGQFSTSLTDEDMYDGDDTSSRASSSASPAQPRSLLFDPQSVPLSQVDSALDVLQSRMAKAREHEARWKALQQMPLYKQWRAGQLPQKTAAKLAQVEAYGKQAPKLIGAMEARQRELKQMQRAAISKRKAAAEEQQRAAKKAKPAAAAALTHSASAQRSSSAKKSDSQMKPLVAPKPAAPPSRRTASSSAKKQVPPQKQALPARAAAPSHSKALTPARRPRSDWQSDDDEDEDEEEEDEEDSASDDDEEYRPTIGKRSAAQQQYNRSGMTSSGRSPAPVKRQRITEVEGRMPIRILSNAPRTNSGARTPSSHSAAAPSRAPPRSVTPAPSRLSSSSGRQSSVASSHSKFSNKPAAAAAATARKPAREPSPGADPFSIEEFISSQRSAPTAVRTGSASSKKRSR
jgi:hypothetical protein